MTGAAPSFPEIWAIDTEFRPPNFPREGDLTQPICWCGRELRSGREVQLWLHEEAAPPAPPHDAAALVITYVAAAEAGVYAALGWPAPRHVVDLMPEATLPENGPREPRAKLIHACTARGIPGMDEARKDLMRDRILAGPPYSYDERDRILAYCSDDVRMTAELWQALPVDLPRALVRGSYSWACGTIEQRGIPIDTATLASIYRHWGSIRARMIAAVNPLYGCPYDEAGRFHVDRLAAWLEEAGIDWPRHPSGKLRQDKETYKDMVKTRPEMQALADLRSILGQTKAFNLPVGADGRTRANLWPMGTKTGRCRPQGSFIFVQSAWLRSLIRPESGQALAYCDYSSEEVLIAGVLSGDEALISTYESGDPYVTFGQAAGLIPPGGTKRTHPEKRGICKTLLLGVNYGMGAGTLAARTGLSKRDAADLLQYHRQMYPAFHQWFERMGLLVQTKGYLRTASGWMQHRSKDLNERAAANFKVQATGSDVLRAAVLLLEEAGIRTLCTVHDAILLEAPAGEIDAAVHLAEERMGRASELILGGHRLRTDATVIGDGERFMDGRGVATWERVMQIIREADEAAQALPAVEVAA
jgi:DNA polymerase-1